MALAAADIADLVTTTQNELGRLKWTDIASDLQDHPAMSQILKKEKVQEESGVAIQRNVMLDHSSAAQHVGLYAVDDVNVADVMATIQIPWRHTTTHYAFERREVAMNRNPARIVDLVKVRRTDAMISLAELMEQTAWGTLTDDGVTPFFLQYWIVYNATTGFNGGNHGQFSAGPGGLNRSTYARWKNWTAKYVNVTKADLIAKMRKAYRQCGFKPPVPGTPQYDRGARRYDIYVNGDTIEDFEELGEAQNENLGRDLASMDGQMVFRGAPIVWVPYLDDYSTSDPVWMVDWSVFYPVFLRGEYMNEAPPRQAPNQHTVMQVFVDLTWNVLCVNPRRLALIAKADPASGI